MWAFVTFIFHRRANFFPANKLYTESDRSIYVSRRLALISKYAAVISLAGQ